MVVYRSLTFYKKTSNSGNTSMKKGDYKHFVRCSGKQLRLVLIFLNKEHTKKGTTWFCSWSWTGSCLPEILHWKGWGTADLQSCPKASLYWSCGLPSSPLHVPAGWPSPFSPSVLPGPTAARAPPQMGCDCVGAWHTSVAGCHWYQWKGHCVPHYPGSLALRSGNACEVHLYSGAEKPKTLWSYDKQKSM